MVWPDGPQMTIKYGAEKMQAACQMTKRREYRHTLITFNTYCFPTTTTVVWMYLNVTLYVRCLPCGIIILSYANTI